MTQKTSRHGRSTTHRGTALAAAAVLSLSVLLAGCTAGDSGASSDTGGTTSDGSAQDGTGGDALAGAGDSGAEAPADGGSGVGTSDSTGDGIGASAPSTDDRQVIQSGDITMTVDKPQDAADAIIKLTDNAGGRIDKRIEHAASGDAVATADLTVRIPSSAVNSTILALRSLGTVDTIELGTDDVTSAAEDLDARIAGMQLSVARMSDLLSKATTSDDITQAEAALTQRQTDLEQLTSQRARLAEQVSLSTLTINLHGPAVVPPPEKVVVATPGPDSFLDGLADGWSSFAGFMGGVATEFGVLLPWLAAGGLITWGLVLLNRRYQRTHPRRVEEPPFLERIPVGVGAPSGPGQPPTAPPVNDPYLR
ncbi:DUF4349 domain-containing protein [Cellulomonas sp. McL0617]|uniref:DUF4349 domain-containing protein n=1 Tax=Cellulomonas sp. McL0617 TaxID=3415675 RepID=UPI003CF10AFB